MAKAKETQLVVTAPNFRFAKVEIEGTAPYVQNRFGNKALQTLIDTQSAGDAGKSKKKREPKDWSGLYKDATHVSTQGWYGIPAATFRAAMISACRTVGVVMTRAKLAVFTEADGFEPDGTPLVRITKGDPEEFRAYARNDNGSTDIRIRPLWQPGWRAVVTLRYDADMVDAQTVVNLLARVGAQVGIGEGRADSKKSCGQGWGFFRIVTDNKED